MLVVRSAEGAGAAWRSPVTSAHAPRRTPASGRRDAGVDGGRRSLLACDAFFFFLKWQLPHSSAVPSPPLSPSLNCSHLLGTWGCWRWPGSCCYYLRVFCFPHRASSPRRRPRCPSGFALVYWRDCLTSETDTETRKAFSKPVFLKFWIIKGWCLRTLYSSPRASSERCCML